MGQVSGDYPVKINKPSKTMRITLRKHWTYLLLNVEQCVGFYSDMFIRDGNLNTPFYPPFMPNTSHLYNLLAASLHRYGRDMPEPGINRLAHFTKYCKYFIQHGFIPIEPEMVLSLPLALENTSYSASRKEEFMRLREKLEFTYKTLMIKGFIKVEGYETSDKNPRAINGPTPELTSLLLPLFRAIDKATFAKDWFVKGSNPREWPSRLEDVLGSSQVWATDFTSFEAHHRDGFSDIIYFWMMHMTRKLKHFRILRKLLAKMVLGVNTIEFKHMVVEILRRLMSGVLWTSSGNGILNLLIMSYLTRADPNGVPESMAQDALSHFKGFVEGDDGICVAASHDPSSVIEELGLKLKMDRHPDYSGAGFCGIVCDRIELTVLKNPIPVCRKFFLLPARYRYARHSVKMALLRSRAMSYKVNFGNCPMIGPLCDLVMSRTKSICIDPIMDNYDSWTRPTLDIAVREKVWLNKAVVSDRSRQLVFETFNINLQEQRDFESACLRDEMPELSTERWGGYEGMHHAYYYAIKPEQQPAFSRPWNVCPEIIAEIIQDRGMNLAEKKVDVFGVEALALDSQVKRTVPNLFINGLQGDNLFAMEHA